VARRDHDAAVELAAEGREIHELRAADADVEHVHARIVETPDELRRERGARRANVAADRHRFRLDERRVCPTDPISDVFVELARNAAANVVRLEARDLSHGSGFPSLAASITKWGGRTSMRPAGLCALVVL
jgi:hypothetical protein